MGALMAFKFSMRKEVLPDALEVLKLVAEHQAILATGHISAREVMVLLRETRDLHIERLLVSHASKSVCPLTREEQKQAIEFRDWIEHSFFAATPSC